MASLSSFMASGGGLTVGDWFYSLTPQRSAPEFLPLNDANATYLQASYPALTLMLPNHYKISASVVSNSLPAITASNNYSDITYGNGLYVAVSTTTSYATSTDGVTWTARTTMPGTNVQAIAYGNGLFVALTGGASATYYTSSDGLTWTTRSAGVNYAKDIIYAGGQFVAVGSQGGGSQLGYIRTSPDGINWTTRSFTNPAGAANEFDKLAYGNGVYVVIDNNYIYGTVQTSPDGITWTQRNIGLSYYCDAITYGLGLFVATSRNTTACATSPDGITWSTRTVPNISPGAIAAGGSVYVLCDSNGYFYAIVDLNIWTRQIGARQTEFSGYPPNTRMVYAGSDTFVAIPVTNTAANHKAVKVVASVGTTVFTLPVITALTNTYTYVKAT